MIVEAIGKVTRHSSLSLSEATGVMEEIMGGEATDAQIASFITGLRMKGETVEEISGFASVMRAKAARVRPKVPEVVDTCGTGGDGANTFNISTAAAFVVAGAGVAIAKHGNRSVSSKSGSADVLERLGVEIALPAAAVELCIEEVGIGFMFAPVMHAAMKHAIGPRKEIAIRTVFNILGPLCNPALAGAQVMGVYDPELLPVMAGVLSNLGVRHALVVHGEPGMDELSNAGNTVVAELKDGEIRRYETTPEEAGLSRAEPAEISGGDPEENAAILRSVLEGEPGPRRDVVLLNAAAALKAADKAPDLAAGVAMAAEAIDSGAAAGKLEGLVELSRRLAQ
ncbi:MAG: anthranilate phosphoribosyltransferase [Actinobacteria bacterium]|nr:MAG: anthranilate phosphoribosyltransferase [Actinomycetota bacterium]